MRRPKAREDGAKVKEEERRLNEEKEAAVRAEDKLAEIQLKRDKEIEELNFRKIELEETRELLARHHQALDKMRRERVNDYIWHRYLLCDGLPNPIIEKEINTYMSLWRMNEDRISMEDVMIDSVNAMKLIDELQTLIADLDENYSELEKYREVMQDLRELVQEKVNRACVETLTKASHFADPETSNLQKIKRYTFEETGITFSIPRLLALSDCAFRILFMKFDTYSVTSLSYRPRVYRSTEEGESTNSSASGIRKALIDTKVDITTVEKRVDAEKANLVEREEREEDRGEMILARSGESQDVEKIDDLFATEKVTAKTSVNLFNILSDEQKERIMETQENKLEDDEIEIPEEDRVETPPKPQWIPIPLPEDAIDLCDYHVVGGVFQFDLLRLPRQPRIGRGWRWTNCVVPPLLAPFEYIVDTPQVDEVEEQNESTTDPRERGEIEAKAKEQEETEEGYEEAAGEAENSVTVHTVADAEKVATPAENEVDAGVDCS